MITLTPRPFSQTSRLLSTKSSVGASSQSNQPVFGQNQASRQTISADHFLQTAPKQQTSLRFGSSSADFNPETFMQNVSGDLEDMIALAKSQAIGKNVTLQDFVLALVSDLHQDSVRYQNEPEKDRFIADSLLGESLGMTRNQNFENDDAVQSRLNKLLALESQLLEARNAEQVPANQRTGKLDDTFVESLFDLNQVFNELTRREPEMGESRLPDLKLFIQVLLDTASQPGVQELGQMVKKLAKVRFDLPAQRYYPSAVQEKAMGALGTSRPVDVSRQVEQTQYQPFPGVLESLVPVVSMMRQPQNRQFWLVVPNTLSKQAVMNTLAHQLQQRQEGEEDDAVGKAGKVYRIDFLNLLAESENEAQALNKLRDSIQKLSADNEQVMICLNDFEGILQKIDGRWLSNFFSELTRDGTTKLTILMDESAFDNEPNPLFLQDQVTRRWSHGFQPAFVLPPSRHQVNQYLQHEVQRLHRDYPDVTFEAEAVEKAVDFAAQTGLQVPDGAMTLLAFTAQRVTDSGTNRVTSDALTQVIQSGTLPQDVLRLKAKPVFEILPTEALVSAVDKEIIGLDNVKQTFDNMMRGIKSENAFKELGVQPIRTMLVVGPSGTGKSALLKHKLAQAELPVVMVYGEQLSGKEPNAMMNALQRAFVAARQTSMQRAQQGLDPHVVVAVDNLEKGVAVSNGQQLKGMLSGILAEQIRLLNLEGNDKILVVANSATGELAAELQDTQILHAVEQVQPMLPKQTTALVQALLDEKEQAVGHPLFAFRSQEEVAGLARQLMGLNGSQIEQVIHETAKWRAAHVQPGESVRITAGDFEKALAKMSMGPENEAMFNEISPEQRVWTAYHETAHALASVIMARITDRQYERVGSLLRLTVVPQGMALGLTAFDNDLYFLGKMTKSQYFGNVVIAVASKIMERMVNGETGTGISNDQEKATQQALEMSLKLNMGRHNRVTLPGELKREDYHRYLSDAAVRQDVDEVIDTAEKVAERILTDYAPFVEAVVDRLVGPDGTQGERVIEGADFVAMLERFEQDMEQQGDAVRSRCKTQIEELRQVVFPEKQASSENPFAEAMDKRFGREDR